MVSERELNRKMMGFVEQCRQKRLAATPQRLAVYRELAATLRHPSAESLYRQVRQALPSISLDTVYRTLRFLEQHQLAERIGSDGDRARYDADVAPHAHFLCKICGRVDDLEPTGHWQPPTPPPPTPLGAIHSVHLEYRGVCAACAETPTPHAFRLTGVSRSNKNPGRPSPDGPPHKGADEHGDS